MFHKLPQFPELCCRLDGGVLDRMALFFSPKTIAFCRHSIRTRKSNVTYRMSHKLPQFPELCCRLAGGAFNRCSPAGLTCNNSVLQA